MGFFNLATNKIVIKLIEQNNNKLMQWVLDKIIAMRIVEVEYVGETYAPDTWKSRTLYVFERDGKGLIGYLSGETPIIIGESERPQDMATIPWVKEFFARKVVATSTDDGLMSAADKVKLDGLRNYIHPIKQEAKQSECGLYNISIDSAGHVTKSEKFVIDSLGYAKETWVKEFFARKGVATSTDDGLMSAADKVKLDGLNEQQEASRIHVREFRWESNNGGTNHRVINMVEPRAIYIKRAWLSSDVTDAILHMDNGVDIDLLRVVGGFLLLSDARYTIEIDSENSGTNATAMVWDYTVEEEW